MPPFDRLAQAEKWVPRASRKAFRDLDGNAAVAILSPNSAWKTWIWRVLRYLRRRGRCGMKQHVYSSSAVQTAFRAKRKAKLRSSLPPQLWRHLVTIIQNREEGDHVDDQNLADVGERAMSMSSVDSSHTDADLATFSTNTRVLIERNRAIQAIFMSIEEAKKPLLLLQRRMEELHALVKHIARREQNFHAEALFARHNAELELTMSKRQKALEDIATQEARLNNMLALQEEGETQIIRSAGAVIRNCQREDPYGMDISGTIKYRLRVLADCAAAPRIKTGARYSHRQIVCAKDELCSKISMDAAFEAQLQEEHYQSRMLEFLDLVDPLHIDKTGLPPREDQAAQQQQIKDNQSRRQRIIDEIDAGIKAIDEAYDKIEDVRDTYSQQRDIHHLLYERERSGVDAWTRAPPPDCDHFEWLHQWSLEVAGETLRRAEAQHREAVNDAVEDQVQHNRENLLGVTDHEDDGFTQSMGSACLNAGKVHFAAERIRVDRWLVGAHGRAYRTPSVPSDVADIETGSDVRCGVSTRGRPIHLENDLIARWAAEVVVMRAEAERQQREMSRAANLPGL